jgi:hypothetical protein
MLGYAETDVFSGAELGLLQRAKTIVAWLPATICGSAVRCHELARAVQHLLLHTEVCDGWYGMVEHSWLWTKKPERFVVDDVEHLLGPFPNILDVYAPGRVPQVQLVANSSALPFEYRRGDPRKDVRADVIAALVERAPRIMLESPGWVLQP